MIKVLTFFLAFCTLPMMLICQSRVEAEEKGQSRLWLDAKSKLTIHVSTNVNGFPCEYTSTQKSEALLIDYEKLDQNYVSIKNASLDFPLNLFDCGQSLKNKEFKEFLRESEYPEIVITLNGLEIFPLTQDGAIGQFIATVEVAAQERKEAIQIVDIVSDESSTLYIGHVNINVKDYGLAPPIKFLGMVKVSEAVQIEFQFRFVGDAG